MQKRRFGMLHLVLVLVAGALGVTLFLSLPNKEATSMSADTPDYVLVIHGGAGTILKKNLTEEKEAEYLAALAEALKAGEEILKSGGTSLDAIMAAIIIMEDSPLFNAGKGAVFTSDGKNELDASIMDGATLNAGAVARLHRIKNPVLLARSVMDHSRHVMLTGEGAEKFAEEQGFDFVDPEYFYTDFRWGQLQTAKEAGAGALILESDDDIFYMDEDHKFGTVGAVALDKDGNLAAATSTGGLTNKRWGRVGDSPIIGAGTYANNASCAVSGTGQGEYFIRATVARDVCALMEYGGFSLKDAANKVIHETLVNMGGDGGIISVDKDGNIALTFNTSGMYRGYIKAGEDPVIAIYKD